MIAIIFIALVLSGCSLKGGKVEGEKIIGMEKAKVKAAEFINANLMPQGQEAAVSSITEEGGLYKVSVDAGGSEEIISYLTKDGKKFFPQVMDIEEHNSGKEDEGESPTAEVKTKKDKPEVELFVMSHCPYGTQIEKGILPVLEILGDKIDFELKFCTYAMHGKTELDEQLRQYCIQKKEPDNFLAYLECFLEDGKAEKCLNEEKINVSEIKKCIDSADKEFKITSGYEDQSTWSGGRYPLFNVYKDDNTKYGVQGSPTLVINEGKVSSGRDPNSLLAAVCSGFNEKPEECDMEVSSVAPAPGFGFEGSGSGDDASCN